MSFEIERSTATRTKFAIAINLIAVMLTAIAVASFFAYRVANSAPTNSSVSDLALRWFAQMEAGQIDRRQLASEYNGQLTDAAVHDMSRYLSEYNYGVPPTRAEVVQARNMGEQTVYEVKLIYPRGDAATLLMGFNAKRQITGISLLGMAGD